MNLRFPYMEEILHGPPAPSLPPSARGRWRPLVPLTVFGPTGGLVTFGRALADSGADDTILPLDIATILGISLLPTTGHAMRWRGQQHALRFGEVVLQIADDAGNLARWRATVAFTAANVRYPLLGLAGCLQFFDALFLGHMHILELQVNPSMPSFA